MRRCVSTTHFGFKTVDEAAKARLVDNVFSKVAQKYDLMNDIMSLGIHRRWKDRFVSELLPIVPGYRLLDVAGGTGDIAFRFVEQAKIAGAHGAAVTVLDMNEQMMQVGQARALFRGFVAQPGLQKPIEWTVGDAEHLAFEADTFDAYTIAFGIRNCTHIDRVLSEAYRVLKPGGRFLCLELSSGAFDSLPVLRTLYDQYSFQIIPVLGQLFAADFGSYRYLVESIRRFPKQKAFGEMMTRAGFSQVCYRDLVGGVATIHSAHKDSRDVLQVK